MTEIFVRIVDWWFKCLSFSSTGVHNYKWANLGKPWPGIVFFLNLVLYPTSCYFSGVECFQYLNRTNNKCFVFILIKPQSTVRNYSNLAFKCPPPVETNLEPVAIYSDWNNIDKWNENLPYRGKKSLGSETSHRIDIIVFEYMKGIRNTHRNLVSLFRRLVFQAMVWDAKILWSVQLSYYASFSFSI